MTPQSVILSVLMLITCAAASCVRDGFSEPIVNLYSYPNVICTNMTIANFGEQVQNFGGDFVLILKNIEFTDLTNVPYFSNRRVQHLIIHHNAQDIGELAFSTFEYLRSLEINDCKFSNNLLKGFQIRNDNLFIQLKMSRNNINRISALCDKSRYLQTVYLSENNITDIGKNNFLECSNLLYLNLSYNAIQRIEPEAFSSLTKLETLDLTANSLSIISANIFTGLSSLLNLNLNNLSIASMEPGAFNGLYNLQSLILSNNNITEVQTDTFNLTKLLTKLDLSRNKIERIAPGALNSLDKLESLDISYNELKHFHCDTSNHSLSDMRSLNLSNNKISTIDMCAFGQFEKLTLLDFSYNTMTKVLRGTFSPLAELKQLNMSNNRLRHLEPALVFPLLELRQLDVSGNLLQDWDAKSVVSHLHHLTHLDFSANKWECHYLMQVLQYLVEKHVNARPNHEPVYNLENVNGIRCADLGMQVNQSGDAVNNGSGLQTLSNENKTDGQFKLGFEVLKELNELKFNEIIKILKGNNNSHETISMDEKVNNIKNITDHKLMYVTENFKILFILSILMLISVSIIFSYLIIKLYLKTRGTCVTKLCESDNAPATSQLLDTYNL